MKFEPFGWDVSIGVFIFLQFNIVANDTRTVGPCVIVVKKSWAENKKSKSHLNVKFFGLDFGVKINTLKAFKIKGFSVCKFVFYSC